MVEEALRSRRVKAVDPVAQSLAVHAADPRSIPSRTAPNDKSRRLWLTSLERRACDRSSSPDSRLRIAPLLAWRESSRAVQSISKTAVAESPRKSMSRAFGINPT